MPRFAPLILAALAALVAVWLPAPAAAAQAPQVESSWAGAVSASSATVSAEVDPGGLATGYRFEYIAQGPDYQAHGFEHAAREPRGSEAGLGSGSVPVLAAQRLVPLSAGTTYHYRIAATNALATTYGPDLTFTTQQSGSTFALPDGRAWELVSPVDKNGGAIQGPGGNFGGDLLQAAGQGGAITYSSASAFGAAPAGAPPASQYLSTRSESGWSTQNITAPTVSGSYGAPPDGVPYRLFSPDLGLGLMLNGVRCRAAAGECPVANPPLPGSGAMAGYQDYYLRESRDGAFTALITAANSELGLAPAHFEVGFAGASPDLAHIVLQSCAALSSGAFEEADGEGCDPAHPNLYEWSGGALSQVNFTASEILPTPPAVLAAPSGAISADGRRVYWSDPESGGLFLHEAGAPERAVQGSTGGGASFQAAGSGGALAFFTEGPAAGQTLYLYEAATATSHQVATEVLGVLGASEDGSVLYYQTAAGLFRSAGGASTEIAAGPEAAAAGDWPAATGTARVSADGSELLFLSRQSLTGYDNTDLETGLPDSEVFLYSLGSGLSCLSCNPTNGRPQGPSTIPGAIANGSTLAYRPRALTAAGRRVFFDSADALLPADSDGRPDVYQWEAGGEGSCSAAAGCLSLLSSGRSGEAAFIDASESGDDAFFLTEASLVGADPGSVDLYDARVGGGLPEAAAPFECLGDACQPLPEAPEDPTVGTTIPGPANPSLPAPKPSCPKGKRKVVKHGKARCVPKHHQKKHNARGHR